MTTPGDVRTLHFRYPNAETGETDNHGIRIQSSDIVTVSELLVELQVPEEQEGAVPVQLRYLSPATEALHKDNYTILAASIVQVINLMNELSVADGLPSDL